MKKLQRKIMRGIYYAYALRLVSLPGVGQGFLMLTSLIALSYFVSIGNVINNLLQIQVSGIGTFFYNAVTTTEVWSLLFIGVFVFALLSLRFSLSPRERVSYSFAEGM